MPPKTSDLEDLAKQLVDSGCYRILRKLRPREPVPSPPNRTDKTGLIIDLETTGLDPRSDEIIEIAALKFWYSDTDEISGVSSLFQSFNQPSEPIPAEITLLTGITDEMVRGTSIDATALEAFVDGVNVVIAHNAAFDRPFAERSWSFFESTAWACSASGIDWRANGFDGSRLGYLLAGAGYFHDAHRAADDCHALLTVLAQPLANGGISAFASLIASARRPTIRIWAEQSPFELKDVLKRRGYRWSDGSDGRLRSWYIDVDDKHRDSELTFLRNEIYQRDAEIPHREITAVDRYSIRA
jgi:DNA polymerase-3 subunit epsilon